MGTSPHIPLILFLLASFTLAGQVSAQVYGSLLLKGRVVVVEEAGSATTKASSNGNAKQPVNKQTNASQPQQRNADIQTNSNGMPLSNATVQLLLLPDSTFSNGGITNQEGNFRLLHFRRKQGVNHLLLKVSYLGMGTYQQELRVSMKEQEVDLGDITLRPKAMTMQEARIVGELKKMYMKGDTLIYNTDAYEMPKGSVLLELVRRLPGLYFSERGQLMYLDKPISEIRLNGEGFFTHDLNIALKNVPVKELDQVKVYETVTEEDKLRGRHYKKQVMDMKTKKDVNITVLANLTAGAANRNNQHLLDGGINYFKKKGAQIALNGNTLNLPGNYDPEHPDLPPTLMQNNSKEWTRKKMRLNWKQGFKGVSINEDLSHTYNNRTNETATSAENYLSGSSLFTEKQDRNNSRETGVRSRSILMKQIRNVSLLFIGNIENAHSQSASQNTSASFNRNPYEYSDQPLESELLSSEQLASICTNRMQQQSLQRSHRKSAGGGLSINKLGGSNTYLINLNTSYSENERSNLTQSSTRFFLLDSIANRHQYIQTPTKSLELSAEFRYGFHIRRVHNIEINYTLRYQTEEQNRFTYDLNRLSGNMEWNIVPSDYASVLVDSISRHADTRSIDHALKLNYRGTLGFNLNLTGEASLLPKHVHATTVTTQKTIADMGYTFLNWNANAQLEYRAGMSHYTFSYNGSSREPSVNDLLPITNDDDPLFLSSGNPNLKQSVSHDFSFHYQNGFAWNAALSANLTDNAITTKTLYNEQTGARSIQPANINGNWRLSSMLDYKNAWKDFTFLARADYSHSNEARYVQNTLADTPDEKGNIRKQKGTLKANFRYTPKKIEVSITMQCDLTRTRNELADNKLFTKDYTTTGEFRAYLPAQIEVNTSFAYRLRRGYNFTSANLNEGIWNAGIRYKFLKEKTASIKLECFDLLKQQKSISYVSSASGNSETRVNCINRYVLLTFSYRFNVFN